MKSLMFCIASVVLTSVVSHARANEPVPTLQCPLGYISQYSPRDAKYVCVLEYGRCTGTSESDSSESCGNLPGHDSPFPDHSPLGR